MREREDDQIKVLLVDDHALFREGVIEIFAAEDCIGVVGEAENGYEAIALAEGRSRMWCSSTWRCP